MCQSITIETFLGKFRDMNDKLLTIRNAPWFQDSNAIVFQESSVQLSQKKIAGMFQTKMQIYSRTILQDTPRQVQEKDCQSVPQDLALLFQNSNVPMSLDRYQGKSVKLFKDNNVKMFQDNNATELQKKLLKEKKLLQIQKKVSTKPSRRNSFKSSPSSNKEQSLI